MNKKRVISTVLLSITPIVSYVILLKDIESRSTHFLNIENVVGIVAILSGITGIVMGFASTRQASLDAVKEYFQQGDDTKYVEARNHIYSTEPKDFDPKYVSDVCNFFHMWGLLNRKKYLPIWVFSGSSGLRIVELYLKLHSTIMKKREFNLFYAKEFEYLSYRIYNKYKKNFKYADFQKYGDDFNTFLINAKKH